MNSCPQLKLVGVSDLTLPLLKRGQGFKPRSRMKSSLCPAFYPLQTDSVQVEISLSCGTGLKILFTARVHSRPPRGSEKKKRRTAGRTAEIGDLQIPSHPRATKYNNPSQSTCPFEGVFALLPITNKF